MPKEIKELKEEVRAYWAGRLAQSERFRKMLGATHVELIDRSLHGDPPDALFEVSYGDTASKKLWCEISGAWRSAAGAQEVFEVVEGKRSRPTGSHGVMLNPDARTAESVKRAIMKKLGKDSYSALRSEHGPGHLHIFLARDHYGLFDGETTLPDIRARVPVADLEDQDIFRSVTFGYDEEVYLLWSDSDSRIQHTDLISSPFAESLAWTAERLRNLNRSPTPRFAIVGSPGLFAATVPGGRPMGGSPLGD